MHDLEHVDPRTLNAWLGNPRQNEKAMSAVAKSIERFGFGAPIVANQREGEREIIAGHTRQLAALKLGLPLVPVRWLDLSPNEAHALALADNKMVELAAWDDAALAKILGELKAADAAIDSLGWDDEALESILGSHTEPPEDPGPPPVQEVAVSVRGEIYELGPHRLMCGDCRETQNWMQLCDGAKINLAFTSPPYAEQRTYDDASGFKPIAPDDYVDWFDAVQAGVKAHLADDGSWFVNIKPAASGLDTSLYVIDLVAAHVRLWGWHFATEFCWERPGVPKSVSQRFKNAFEPIYQFVLGRWKMRPDEVRHESKNVPLGRGPGSGNTSWNGTTAEFAQGGSNSALGKRKRKNGTTGNMAAVQGAAGKINPGLYVVEGMAYPSNRLPTFASDHEATGHTAAFPVGLPQFFVKAYTDFGDLVCDPFMGSGSTLIAAAREERQAIGFELSPLYCDVIRRRWTKWARAAGVDPGPGALDDA